MKNHRINKARISFIEMQIKRLGFERSMGQNGSAQGESYTPSCASFTNTVELIGLYGVREEEMEYGTSPTSAPDNMLFSLKQELKHRTLLLGLVEDAVDMLGSIDFRYKRIIEEYYIKNCRMEDIAAEIHVSRSKCYEFCKEAIAVMEKVILGNAAWSQVKIGSI